jgi:hypothetical protein
LVGYSLLATPPDRDAEVASEFSGLDDSNAALDQQDRLARDPRWEANRSAVAEWLASGGHPSSPREDLLRDLILLWDEWPEDDAAWEALATLLATLSRFPRGSASGAYSRAAHPAEIYLALLGMLDEYAASGTEPARANVTFAGLLTHLRMVWEAGIGGGAGEAEAR